MSDKMIRMSGRGLELLKQYEGFVPRVYRCPAGFRTLGYGHNIDANPLTPYQQDSWDKDPKATAEALLRLDLEKFEKVIQKKKPFVRKWDQPRIDAVIDMTFNMGAGWMDSWPNTWRHLERKQWSAAANGIRDSRYAKQVGKRAQNNAFTIESGEYA